MTTSTWSAKPGILASPFRFSKGASGWQIYTADKMQLDLRDNSWRHHGNCTKPRGGVPFYLEIHPSMQESTTDHLCDTATTTPEDRRPRLLDYSSPDRAALNPTQQETLALQTQPENSDPGVQGTQLQEAALQTLDAQEEIAPGDIKYRLEPLRMAPLEMQRPSCFGQYSKPQGVPFSTTYGESFKPWKIEPGTHCGEKSSHSGAVPCPRHTSVVGTTNPGEYSTKQGPRPSLFKNLLGDYDMTTTHQISFQKPLLGQSVFSAHIQGRKVALTEHPGHMEYISQYQRDFQAPGKYIQHVQKETAPGWPPTTQLHQELSRPKQTTILGGNSTAKFDGDTVTRLSYLPKTPVKRVKGKCPSSTLGVFKAKFQTETTSKKFFQDWGAQPQVCYGPHDTGYEKPPAPPEDQTTTRTAYMPLFSERVKLCEPKSNSIKSEASSFSTEHRKSFRPVQLPESQLQKDLCLKNRKSERLSK